MAITEAEAAAYAALAALERARETLWQKGRGKLMTYRPNAWEVARTIAMKRRYRDQHQGRVSPPEGAQEIMRRKHQIENTLFEQGSS